MSERVKAHRKTRFLYGVENGENVCVGEEEEVYEPVDASTSEFVGVSATLSLAHGVAPPEPVGEWSVYKVYEKVVIWLRRVAPTGKEASP